MTTWDNVDFYRSPPRNDFTRVEIETKVNFEEPVKFEVRYLSVKDSFVFYFACVQYDTPIVCSPQYAFAIAFPKVPANFYKKVR